MLSPWCLEGDRAIELAARIEDASKRWRHRFIGGLNHLARWRDEVKIAVTDTLLHVVTIDRAQPYGDEDVAVARPLKLIDLRLRLGTQQRDLDHI
jgi:hypothetical protein